MSEGRRVLVTGVSSSLAAALTRRLERRDDVEYVAGLDTETFEGLEPSEFVRGDVRTPMVAGVIESARIDTIVHLGLRAMVAEAGGRARMKETNVIGTMQVLGAAQKAPRVRQVVLRSTTAVYGTSHRHPALLPEDAAVAPPGGGYAKDAADAEGYARTLARRRDDVTVTVLRMANPVGATVETPLSKYFALPVTPTVLGYDPRLQFLHETDAIDVLERSTLEPHPGVYNVAGPGVVYLSQALRLAGKPTFPIAKPLMPWAAGALRRAGMIDFSADQLEFMLHGRVADIARLRERFGFTPRYSTRAAFEEFLTARGIEPLIDPALLDRAERWALRTLTGQGGAAQ